MLPLPSEILLAATKNKLSVVIVESYDISSSMYVTLYRRSNNPAKIHKYFECFWIVSPGSIIVMLTKSGIII